MSTATVDRETLKRRILQVAGRSQTFSARTGTASPHYLEKYRFITRPDLLRDIARGLASHVPPETGRLAATELGATPIVAALALETGLPFVIIRTSGPSGGIGAAVEGEYEPGDRFTLVEDMLLTGNSAMEAIARVSSIGGRVVGCLAVVDRGRGAVRRLRDAGVRCECLVTIADHDFDA